MLDKVNCPDDLRALDENEIPALCEEIREFIINHVSKTGGHLSSNLGAVELTVAIHRLFDTGKDRLLFDVGHQSYAHKILTGRKDRFDTLRQIGGIAGFPKPSESAHDAFIAGHASSSISVALGMARARTLLGDDYNVIAVVGDGALTGGLSYEGLCDAGASGEPLIVILNDNGMSINKNVGGMAKYLARERVKPGYISFKNKYRRFMHAIPGGKYLYKFIHNIKTAIKEALLHCSMFEDMGFRYLGPVDGHDIKRLEEALTIAKDAKCPALVHVITKKGKGYSFAEKDPDKYHGVSGFDPVTGELQPSHESFSSVFGDELISIARQDKRIIAVTAAMESGTGLEGFSSEFPERLFDVGIAEGHAASMVAGAAKQGLIPVLAIYSTFLQRSYDMLLEDVGISGVHAVIAVDRAGIAGEDGETHQGIFDVSYLSSIPGMTILSPASFSEMRDMLRYAVYSVKGPVAVRYPRGEEGLYKEGGTEKSVILRTGSDITLVSYGESVNTLLEAAEELEKHGIYPEIVKLGQIKPLILDDVLRSVRKTGKLLVLEECVSSGSVGEEISSRLAGTDTAVSLMNLGDRFVTHGKPEKLRELYELDRDAVVSRVLGELHEKSKT